MSIFVAILMTCIYSLGGTFKSSLIVACVVSKNKMCVSLSFLLLLLNSSFDLSFVYLCLMHICHHHFLLLVDDRPGHLWFCISMRLLKITAQARRLGRTLGTSACLCSSNNPRLGMEVMVITATVVVEVVVGGVLPRQVGHCPIFNSEFDEMIRTGECDGNWLCITYFVKLM